MYCGKRTDYLPWTGFCECMLGFFIVFSFLLGFNLVLLSLLLCVILGIGGKVDWEYKEAES